jgi:hypothetical protein
MATFRPLVPLILIFAGTALGPCATAGEIPSAFLGFDRNEYPGDANLKELRKTFAFTGYWLSTPPSAKINTWSGKRARIESAGFGFLVLFNGRLYRELKKNAALLGERDAQTVVASAKREGFSLGTIIFLDQEEGGRLLPEQKAYLFAWIDGVSRAGFRAGIYCSGMAAQEEAGASIKTADDIQQNAGRRDITYWVTNDACPPSPGCVVNRQPSVPEASGIDFADVWQFAQSPRRRDVAGSCRGYDKNGSCYATAFAAQRKLYFDLDVATSADPSHGRTRKP